MYNYVALWVGMAHNVTTYLLAAALIQLGMSWVQALITIGAGNVIVLIPMLLTSHAGAKYGITFPVLARASFGVWGANIATVSRAVIACGWFGIDAWIGGQATFLLGATIIGTGWEESAKIGGYPWTLWLSFAIFLLANVILVLRGFSSLRLFENWAAPLVIVVALVALVWMVSQAQGLGPILGEPSRLGWGAPFWKTFAPALMAMVAFWAPMSLNMSDFTRFAKSQRAQWMGQLLGLPTTMTGFSLIAVCITSATVVVYGEPLWDPVELTRRLPSSLAVVVGLVTIMIATLSVNVAANLVSPSVDFVNIWPRRISLRAGVVITSVVAILLRPWYLLDNPELYIFAWLQFGGGALGAIAGIIVSDYWLVRRTSLDVGQLYMRFGRYRYRAGVNWVAVTAFLGANLIALGGAHSASGEGPFPSNGMIPLLRPFYDYSWAVSFALGGTIYCLLTRFFGDPTTFERRDRESQGVLGVTVFR